MYTIHIPNGWRPLDREEILQLGDKFLSLDICKTDRGLDETTWLNVRSADSVIYLYREGISYELSNNRLRVISSGRTIAAVIRQIEAFRDLYLPVGYRFLLDDDTVQIEDRWANNEIYTNSQHGVNIRNWDEAHDTGHPAGLYISQRPSYRYIRWIFPANINIPQGYRLVDPNESLPMGQVYYRAHDSVCCSELGLSVDNWSIDDNYTPLTVQGIIENSLDEDLTNHYFITQIMPVRRETRIPAGFRLLSPEENIQEGDYYSTAGVLWSYHMDIARWVQILPRDDGMFRREDYSSGIYIRAMGYHANDGIQVDMSGVSAPQQICIPEGWGVLRDNQTPLGSDYFTTLSLDNPLLNDLANWNSMAGPLPSNFSELQVTLIRRIGTDVGISFSDGIEVANPAGPVIRSVNAMLSTHGLHVELTTGCRLLGNAEIIRGGDYFRTIEQDTPGDDSRANLSPWAVVDIRTGYIGWLPSSADYLININRNRPIRIIFNRCVVPDGWEMIRETSRGSGNMVPMYGNVLGIQDDFTSEPSWLPIASLSEMCAWPSFSYSGYTANVNDIISSYILAGNRPRTLPRPFLIRKTNSLATLPGNLLPEVSILAEKDNRLRDEKGRLLRIMNV